MKNLRSKIIFAFFLLIVVFYFLFTFGFRIIFSITSFIGNINKNLTPTPPSQIENFIGNINIDSIPQATNSAKFIVQGSVLNFNKITFYLNDEKIKETDLAYETIFSEEIGNLREGKNSFYAIAKNKNHSFSKKTPVYEIFYKSKKPTLEVFEPKDGDKFSNQEIIIKGKTDKETFIKINDIPVIVDAVGNFQTSLILKNEGENKIQINASDLAGNIETKELTVFYQK